MIKLITPHWPAPPGVHAFSTTRAGGVSFSPWNSLNVGAHCGDNAEHVAINRARVFEAMNLPSSPVWLEQVHGNKVLKLEGQYLENKRADASWTTSPNVVCAVMTADCLPVLFCNFRGTEVAAAHAGWRGLCEGVLENTVAAFQDRPENLIAWLGPAIGPGAFEVGSEVRDAFMAKSVLAEKAFKPQVEEGKYLADIYQLARQRLVSCGVRNISGGDRCTFNESDDFFSYRRDQITGRMASFIWLL